MALPIPNRASVVALVGNNVDIPRGADIALCAPAGNTVYNLPALEVEPETGSYMYGQTLQLRNLTAHTITLTPAEGDTISGAATLAVTSQQYIVLVYRTDSDWSIVARLTSVANPEPTPEELEAAEKKKAAKKAAMKTAPTAETAKPSPTAETANHVRAKLPMTSVKSLPKRR